jgi:hypothetical protein
MTEGWGDNEDRQLAQSIFGTEDQDSARSVVVDWLSQQGFRQARIGAIELSVGAAVAVDLPDDSKIFVKVWSAEIEAAPLRAQLAVQRFMAAKGFPAPALLTDLSRCGPGWAVAMEYNRAGLPTDVRISGVRSKMASGLAKFVTMSRGCLSLEGLPKRELPKGRTWPKPHNALFDFEATAKGAEWIDAAASEGLTIMRAAKSPLVVGHHDWSAKNMRMDEGALAVVYDWDAVFIDRETFVLGSAAAHFPVTWELDVPETPVLEEVEAIIHDYEQARGAPLTIAELAETAATATYARAYKARCEHALDPNGSNWHGSSRESLKLLGAFRFPRQ